MADRHEHDQPVVLELDAVEAGVGGQLRRHPDIGLVVEQLLQHRRGAADAQREGEAAVIALQRREDRHGVIGAVGAHPQVPAGQRLGAGEQGAGLVLQREQPGGDVVEALADGGELGAPAAALEQLQAIARLQRPDLARQGRLAQPRRRRRAGEAALAGDEMEGAELGQVHIEMIYIEHK